MHNRWRSVSCMRVSCECCATSKRKIRIAAVTGLRLRESAVAAATVAKCRGEADHTVNQRSRSQPVAKITSSRSYGLYVGDGDGLLDDKHEPT